MKNNNKKAVVATADDLVQSLDQLVDAAKRVVAADEKLQELEIEDGDSDQSGPARSSQGSGKGKGGRCD